MTEDDYNKIAEIVQRDRRVCERLNVQLDIFFSPEMTLEVISPLWKGPYKLDNIGGEGISFGCDEEIPSGTKVSFKFTLPLQPLPMIVTGTVIWKGTRQQSQQKTSQSKFFVYGAKFDKIKSEFEEQFLSFISEAIMDKYLDKDGNLKAE